MRTTPKRRPPETFLGSRREQGAGASRPFFFSHSAHEGCFSADLDDILAANRTRLSGPEGIHPGQALRLPLPKVD